METNMTLSFDPSDPYVKMIMNLSDEKLTQFFDSMGINVDLSLKDEDEGFVFDCEA